MKIKNRLALYFTLISAVILLIALTVILVTFKSFARSDFYGRLLDRAKVPPSYIWRPMRYPLTH